MRSGRGFIRRPLQFKATALVAVFLMIASFVSVLICFVVFRNNAIKIAEDLAKAYLEQLTARFDSHMTTIQKSTLLLSFNKDIRNMINQPNLSSQDNISLIQRNQQLVMTFSNTGDDIAFISLYEGDRGRLYLSNGRIVSENEMADEVDYLKKRVQAMDSKLFTTWNEARYIRFPSMRVLKEEAYFSLITSIPESDKQSFVTAYIKESFIAKGYLSGADTPYVGTLFMTNRDGRIISAQNKSLLGQIAAESEMLDTAAKEHLLISRKSEKTGWTFNLIIARAEINRRASSDIIASTFLAIAAVVCFLALMSAMLIRGFLYKPIRALTRTLNRSVRDEHADANSAIAQREDEIGDIYRYIKSLLARNSELVSRSYMQTIQQNESDLKLLHSKIDAHFLNNTLDSIIWMARDGNCDGIIEITDALMKLYRISLQRDSSLIDISVLLSQTYNYLRIQKLRFGARLDATVAFDEGIMPLRVMRQLLQPVIENSINYGVEKKKGPAVIKISGSLQPDCILFTVEDNGVGISGEELNRLHEMLAGDDLEGRNGGNFSALYNINLRIRLFHGEGYGISITSTHGEGTCVTIRVPNVT